MNKSSLSEIRDRQNPNDFAQTNTKKESKHLYMKHLAFVIAALMVVVSFAVMFMDTASVNTNNVAVGHSEITNFIAANTSQKVTKTAVFSGDLIVDTGFNSSEVNDSIPTTTGSSTGSVVNSDSTSSNFPEWAGYAGNNAIYLSTGDSNKGILTSGDPWMPSSVYSLWHSIGTHWVNDPSFGEGTGYGGYTVPFNAVSVGAGGSGTSGSNVGQQYEEYYDPINGKMVVSIPITLAGTSDWNHTYQGDSNWEDDYIDNGLISVNIPHCYSQSVSTLQTGYDSGINVSQTYTTGTMGIDISTLGENTAWYLLNLAASAIPGLGPVISTAQYEDSLFSPAGIQSNPDNSQVGPGNFSLANFGLEHEMTQTGTNYDGVGDVIKTWGYDTYALSTVVEIEINQINFTNANHLTIGARNTMESLFIQPPAMLTPPYVVTNNEAYSSLQINVFPAYTVHGTAYLNGVRATNTRLVAIAPTGNFNVYTNSTGQYQFFAEPGVITLLTYPSASNGGAWIDPLISDTGGGTYNLNNLSTVTFTETGLPSSDGWKVKLTGPMLGTGTMEPTTKSTTGSSITFTVEGNGETYNFSASSTTSGWYASPSSGYITAGNSKSISFSQNSGGGGSGGGGGGCILYGTLVSTSMNHAVPVQDLKVGENILSYDSVNQQFIRNTITSINVTTNVTTILDIDFGLLHVSGMQDQPIYALLPNGTAEWIMIGQLTTSDSILNPITGMWIPVFSLHIEQGIFKVYEINGQKTFYQDGHYRFTYMANSVLLDKKMP